MRRTQGFTLVEIMITIAIIGMIAIIAIPNYIKIRLAAQRNICIMNLQMLSTAKDLFADDNELSSGTPVDLKTDLVGQYLKTNPECPTGGAYTIGATEEAIMCGHNGTPIFYPEERIIIADDPIDDGAAPDSIAIIAVGDEDDMIAFVPGGFVDPHNTLVVDTENEFIAVGDNTDVITLVNSKPKKNPNAH